MCGSCVQPAVSGILKRSIKKALMVVRLMTAERGEQGGVNSGAETCIPGTEGSKRSVAGRKPIVVSHKARLSFCKDESTAVSLPGQHREQPERGESGPQSGQLQQLHPSADRVATPQPPPVPLRPCFSHSGKQKAGAGAMRRMWVMFQKSFKLGQPSHPVRV